MVSLFIFLFIFYDDKLRHIVYNFAIIIVCFFRIAIYRVFFKEYLTLSLYNKIGLFPKKTHDNF